MITTALIFGVTFFLSLLVSWTLAAPIFFPAPQSLDKPTSEGSLLEQERLYFELEELEADYRAGKLPTQDYADERERIVSTLASLMREDEQVREGA